MIGLSHAVVGIKIAIILKNDFRDFYDRHFCKLFTATSLLFINTWAPGLICIYYALTPIHEDYKNNDLIFTVAYSIMSVDITAIT